MKKQAEISRNPMIYNNPEFEKPVKMVDFCRTRVDKANAIDAMVDQVEKIKASIRAKVEHPFRVIKRQFGYVKVRYRGLKQNTAQLTTLFALLNLWMMRCKLMQIQG